LGKGGGKGGGGGKGREGGEIAVLLPNGLSKANLPPPLAKWVSPSSSPSPAPPAKRSLPLPFPNRKPYLKKTCQLSPTPPIESL